MNKSLKHIAGYSVHAFTALGAILGLWTLYAIYKQEYILAFWYMGATILIDAVDGTFARLVDIKQTAPRINGELLDNIIDYLNYVITPAFFLLVSDILPPDWCIITTSLVVLASAYQFTQSDAKTADHFFKGFPDYWNIVAFYLFVWQLTQTTNLFVILTLVILVFFPIKYIYPSRMEHVTRHTGLRTLLLMATVLWGVVTALMLWTYPAIPRLLTYYTLIFGAIYILMSVYRTLYPLKP